MGIDYGKAPRIGVALSDELQNAGPSDRDDSHGEGGRSGGAKSRALVFGEKRRTHRRRPSAAHERQGGYVGLTKRAVFRGTKLRAKVECEVRTWDERLSTVAAQRALREAGKSVRESRGYIDQVAAQMLLQSYLDSLLSQPGRP